MGTKKALPSVAKDASGTFVRNIGWKQKGDGYVNHRFYLGKESTGVTLAEAQIRVVRLEQCWGAVETRWQQDRLTPRPVWDEFTLQIGSAVAKGETIVTVSPPADVLADGNDDPATLVSWLRPEQEFFPFIRLTLDDQTVAEGEAHWNEVGKEFVEHGKKLLKKNRHQKLHQALDAFIEAQRAHYTNHSGVLSPTGSVAIKEIERIKQHQPDMPLGDFDNDAIERMIDHWRLRPTSKAAATAGKPVAVRTVVNVVKRIRVFLRWLKKSKEFDWKLPDDYEPKPLRITRTHEENAKRVNSDQVATYTLEQLGLLWKYATPQVRAWMVTSLNTGFGKAELASVQKSEVHRNMAHKKFGLKGSFIQRIRFKNGVYSEWLLWDQTVAGINWHQSQYPTDTNHVFVNGAGRPLIEQTSGGNMAQTIPNHWDALTKKIREDYPDFPKLSFNKLRKTAINGIREIAGGEIAGIFASHGQAVSDGLLELYTNRPFDAVFDAITKWGEKLAVVFNSNEKPFEKVKRKHGKSEKWLAEAKQVLELRAAGESYKSISEKMCGMSVGMIRHYLSEGAKAFSR